MKYPMATLIVIKDCEAATYCGCCGTEGFIMLSKGQERLVDVLNHEGSDIRVEWDDGTSSSFDLSYCTVALRYPCGKYCNVCGRKFAAKDRKAERCLNCKITIKKRYIRRGGLK
jgi:hypothetical protein